MVADFGRAFKEADIRGVYPIELDDETAYCIARAFVQIGRYRTVLVGRDMRISSPALAAAFVKGAIDAGADVIDLGLVDTSALYFASGSLALPGAMITASHSPKDHNGFKLVFSGAVPLTEKTGLRAIRKLLERGRFVEVERRGRVTSKNIYPAYARALVPTTVRAVPPLRIVVDVGNGMGAQLLPIIAKRLPLDLTALFTELDGTFPQRGSNPTLPKNQAAITKAIQAGDYDFGIAFDGDADRIVFFDERGRPINCAHIGAKIAEHLLKKHPGARMAYTVLTSRAYKTAIEASGGTPVFARVGHSFIKEAMRKQDALFGCEHSGHFFYKDFYYTDSVVHTLSYVCTLFAAARAGGATFSSWLWPLSAYIQTEDVMVDVSDKRVALAQCAAFAHSLAPKRITKRDGLTIDFGSAWVVVKPSVTEAALNIIVESENEKTAHYYQRQFVKFVRSLATVE